MERAEHTQAGHPPPASSRSTSPRASRSARRRSSTARGSASRLRPFAASSPSSSRSGCSRTRTPRRAASRPTPATASTRARCSSGQAPRPERFPLDLTSMRSEVEAALQSTTEMLGQVTRLLALVSAPGHETATVRHIEVLLLQPSVVMVVTITSAGGVAKKLLTFSAPVDPGLAAWANEYLNERLDRRRARNASGAEAVRRPEPVRRRARLPRCAEARVRRARDARGAVAVRRRRRLAARRRAGGRARGLPAASLRAREARRPCSS